jgi:twinkle protein
MSTDNMRPIGEIYNDANDELLHPYPSIKLPDWEYFNEATGGLRAGEYSIICGPTGSGKTTWLANLSLQLLLKRVPHFVASVETGATDYVKRVMSALARMDLNTGEPAPLETLKKIYREYGPILKGNDMWLSLYDGKVAAEQLAHDILVAHEEYGCQVAILDNLNYFLEITKAQDSVIEIDRATRVFIELVKRHKIHVFMVMHPKKVEGDGRIESELDIKGSSTAVQEAYNVFLFNRPKADEQNQFPRNTHRELKIAKMRRKGKYVYRRIMYRNVESYYAEEAFL